MLAGLLDALWMCGAICSAVLLAYGGFLIYVFQSNASSANQRAVASLALHESVNENLAEMKESALLL